LRQLERSEEQARLGNLPRLLHQDAVLGPEGQFRAVYGVRSRTPSPTKAQPAIYLVQVAGDGVTCDCQAGRAGLQCWHVLHVRRARAGTIGTLIAPEVNNALA
jgi:hypothetical protein